MKEPKYDLEERLLGFAVRVIRVSESMPRTRAGNHVADQWLRAGTSPYGHHGEAEGAESRQDFVQRTPLVAKPALLNEILTEAEELIRIFAASIRTATSNGASSRQNLSVKRSALKVERSAPPRSRFPTP